MFVEVLAEVFILLVKMKGTTQLKKYIFTLFGRKSRSSKTFMRKLPLHRYKFSCEQKIRLKSTYFIRLFSYITVSAKKFC